MHNKTNLDYISAVTNIVYWSEEGSPFQDRYALVISFSLLHTYENVAYEGCCCV